MLKRFNVPALIDELKVCSSSRNLERGRKVHEAAIRTGDHTHVCVSNTLINMYGRCGVLDEACHIFEQMHTRTVVSWNALISGYAANGEAEMAMCLFSRMEHEGCAPDERSFLVALKVCADLAMEEGADGSRKRGTAVHLLASTTGCDSDTYMENALVNMYVKCRNIDAARMIFEKMRRRTVVSWTVLMMGYTENGKGEVALSLFWRMGECCSPDARAFVAALKACSDLATKEDGILKFRDHGKALHMLALTKGCDSDIFLRNTLVDMYAKLRNMQDARTVFDRMRTHDVISWTNLIMGYAENGEGEIALNLLSRMETESCTPDARTFVAAIKACTELREDANILEAVRALHLLVSLNSCENIYVNNTLVDIYGKCGSMVDARGVFENMKHQDVVSWTALILGYAENGESDLALDLFLKLEPHCVPDGRVFVAALKACTELAVVARNSKFLKLAAERGKAIHLILTCNGCESDIYVASTLVDFYAKCKHMDDGRRVFDSMIHHDVVPWTALILGYAENGEPEEALTLFWKMNSEGCSPIPEVFVAALNACTDLEGNGKLDKDELRERGSAIHVLASSNGCDSSKYVRNILVDMYSKCRSMEDARRVFEDMDSRDVVCWTALMLGYAENGEARLVLELYPRMKREGCEPDPLCYIPVLKACGMLGASDYGKAVHADIRHRNFENEALVSTILVDFYSRCGNVSEAEKVFASSGTRDVAAWNSLIAGYGRYGDTRGAFAIFDRMMDAGVRPNSMTFVYVLTTCSHAGLVNKGKEYFEAMATKHEIIPLLEHFICMVDLLGRANRLDEAMLFLRSMVFTPDAVTWTTILGACRKWKRIELASLAFESVISLNDRIGGAYALMYDSGS